MTFAPTGMNVTTTMTFFPCTYHIFFRGWQDEELPSSRAPGKQVKTGFRIRIAMPTPELDASRPQFLWRSVELLLASTRRPVVDYPERLLASVGDDPVICRAETTIETTIAEHVLRGMSKPSQYLSTSASRTCALLFSLWMWGKYGPYPSPGRHGDKLPMDPHPSWDSTSCPLILEIECAKLGTQTSLTALNSMDTCKAAGLCNRGMAVASARARSLSEVLVVGNIVRSAVVATYQIQTNCHVGRRILKHAFWKDYFSMVHPKAPGRPDWENMHRRLAVEFACEGAYIDAFTGEAILPDFVWEGLKQNAPHKL